MHGSTIRLALGAFVAVMTNGLVARADLELKNDSFATNGQTAFQGGFVAGESGASRFVAPDAGRTLQKIQFLFGGATTAQELTVNVYDDSAGTNAPGTRLLSETFSVTGSNANMQEITFSSQIVVPAQFRIAIEFAHNGLPSISRDTDGIHADRNFIFASPGGWLSSASAGLSGDWVIRAFVSGDASTVPDGAGSSGGDAGASGGACNGNGECPSGQFCDTAVHACTFDCRSDSDCGGGTCNSLGQCIGARASGGCSTYGGGVAGVALFGLAIAAVVLRRRRST